NRRIVAIHLVKAEPVWLIDRSDNVETQIAGFLSGLRGVEQDELQEVVNSLRLHFETNHNHVHGHGGYRTSLMGVQTSFRPGMSLKSSGFSVQSRASCARAQAAIARSISLPLARFTR